MQEPLILTDTDYDRIIAIPEEGVIDASMELTEFHQLADKLKTDKRIDTILIPEICIRKRITALAHKINKDFKEDPIEVMMVLTGAFMFGADLCRELYRLHNRNARFYLIKTSVYDETIKAANEKYRAVKLELDPRGIKHHDILLIEDIIDQGFTMTWLLNYLQTEREVRTIKVCSLLNKILAYPTHDVKKLRASLVLDYIGFNIPDVWIAGYGIDAGHDFRNLPFIVSVNKSYYLGGNTEGEK